MRSESQTECGATQNVRRSLRHASLRKDIAYETAAAAVCCRKRLDLPPDDGIIRAEAYCLTRAP